MLSRLRAVLGVIILVVLLIGSTFSLVATPIEIAEGKEPDLPPIELPDKGNPRLDSALNQLVSTRTSARVLAFAQDNTTGAVDSVRVIIESLPGQLEAVSENITKAGFTLETSYDNLLQAVVPVTSLTALADTPGIRFVRLPWRPLPDVTSQGVALINADDWHTAGYNGAGVKVGILDGGFSGYTTRQSQGELPATITTWWAPSIGGPGTSFHGTACAEIVYDIAPSAQFYLANFRTEVEMGNAVNWLISQGVNVISCSVGWPVGGPGDGTGTIDAMVDRARAAGILWSQAAGNSAQQHWSGSFSDADADGWLNFSGTDETNNISVSNGQPISVDLKWDDTWGASGNDYDLYLIDSSGTVVAKSENAQNGTGDPVEGLDYTATYTGVYYIAIAKYGAPAVVNFHLYAYNLDLQYPVASGSLTVPADSPSAVAVGAVRYSTPTTLEPFSSCGPTKDGRIKPDLVAPDGVSTASYDVSAFYGTSAAAPHAAGAAVLVKQRYPSYTPAQIQSYLESRAADLGTAGKDNLYGSGRLDLGLGDYTLTMAVSGSGSVTPAVGNHTYPWGTVVNIQATPASGWRFVNWNGEVNNSTSAATTVTMNRNKTVTANFSATLASITISPANPTVVAGRTQQFAATGIYGDGSSTNLTGSVTWASSNTTVARISTSGLAIGYTQGTANITATSGSISGITRLTVGPKVLEAIAVIPANPTIPSDRTQQFIATATYSDNSSDNLTSSVTWASSNTTVASINMTGLATGHTRGTANITATSGNVSGAAILTVGPKVPPAMILTPANPTIAAGRTQQFTATGTYSDNSTEDVTGFVIWSSSNTIVARISSAGLATSYAQGTANITAVSENITARTLLTVGPKVPEAIVVIPPNPTIVAGRTQQFIATRIYSDNSSDNLTSSVNWTSSNPIVASINATGLATGYARGSANITAASGNVSGTTLLTVKALEAIAVTPASPTIAAGRKQQFAATGTYSDSSSENFTNSVNWTSSNTIVASINMTGMATSYAQGTTNITAASGNVSGTTTLTVGPKVLDAIAATPVNPTIALGRTQQFTATGTYSDSSSENFTNSVTWTSSNTTVARITAAGLATSYSQGTANITAASGNISGITTLTIGPKVLDAIAVTPPNPIIAVSGMQQFTATGTYSDSSSGNLTDSVTWSSSNTTVVRISTAGLATGYAQGTANITAASGNVSGITLLTIRTLAAMFIVPANPTIVASRTQQFTASVTYSDNSSDSLTSFATWSSSNTTVAKISTAGLATGYTRGTANMTVTSGNVSAGTILTVKVLQAIAVTPTNPTIAVGRTQQFTATGAYSDNSSDDLTGSVTWRTSNATVAGISTTGLATGYAQGTASIAAVSGNVSGSTTLTVIAAVTTSTGGGGGGGGGGAVPVPVPTPVTTPVTLSGLTTTAQPKVDGAGVIQERTTIESEDKKLFLQIDPGTKMLDAKGKPLTALSASQLTSAPVPPSGRAIIVAYDFGPDGTTFAPPITLTMSYDPTTLPAGVDEAELYIAFWDGNQWQNLESVVNTTNKTIAAKVEHFTNFCVIAKLSPPPPPNFDITALSITPATVKTGDTVVISVMVVNTGGSTGKYSVILTIDSIKEDIKEIAIDAGVSQTVNFSVRKSAPNDYKVDVNGLTGSFTVRGELVSKTAIPTPAPTPTPVPEPTTNWSLIIGIVAGVALLGVVLYIMVRTRRGAGGAD